MSPAAAAATAVGVGIGVADHSAILAVVLGAVGWAGRMAAALVRRRRLEHAARPHPAEVDPWSVPEPWRQMLAEAAAAQHRFDRAVDSWPSGPTRDRLEELRPRVWSEVAALVVVAHQGAAAAGGPGAAARPFPTTEELRALQREKATTQPGSARAAEIERREAALAAQLRARRRRDEVTGALQDRMRTALARLDEAVSDLVALGAESAVDSAGAGVGDALDELSDGIASLRSALSETDALPPGPPPSGAEP